MIMQGKTKQKYLQNEIYETDQKKYSSFAVTDINSANDNQSLLQDNRVPRYWCI